MNIQPTRKPLRMKHYDYTTPGVYFITICTADKSPLFWDDVVEADIIRPRCRKATVFGFALPASP